MSKLRDEFLRAERFAARAFEAEARAARAEADRDKWRELALTNAEEVKAWRARDSLKAEADRDRYREALETIAVFNSRDSGYTGLPSAEARIAREALSPSEER